jgi:hypothetical protein
MIYNNYEKLVGVGLRVPAPTADDRRRAVVGGHLFGSYAEEVVYGALSLTGDGVPTYGCVYCQLKDVAVSDRVSFLESNSYVFINEHGIDAEKEIPAGYRAVWDNRHELAVAKLGSSLLSGQSEEDWQAVLIGSDGTNRSEDDFIEAHVFGGFTVQALSTMRMATGLRLSSSQKLDAGVALDSFSKLTHCKENVA